MKKNTHKPASNATTGTLAHPKPWTFNQIAAIIGDDKAEKLAIRCKNRHFKWPKRLDLDHSWLTKIIGRPAVYTLLHSSFKPQDCELIHLTSKTGYVTEMARLILLGRLSDASIARRFNVTLSRVAIVRGNDVLLKQVAGAHCLPYPPKSPAGVASLRLDVPTLASRPRKPATAKRSGKAGVSRASATLAKHYPHPKKGGGA
jgi:hypothetical protein